MRDMPVALAVLMVVTVVGAIAGCSPLPGATLDPLYLGEPRAPAPASSPSPPPASTAPPAAAHVAAAGSAGEPGTWAGRYRDNRGEGEITLTLTRTDTGLAGTWRLRTGGGGRLHAVAQPNGARLSVHMESQTTECPAKFDGWLELADVSLVGAYHGSDCEGLVSDGRLDLRRR